MTLTNQQKTSNNNKNNNNSASSYRFLCFLSQCLMIPSDKEDCQKQQQQQKQQQLSNKNPNEIRFHQQMVLYQ
jgi:hypothetical protein